MGPIFRCVAFAAAVFLTTLPTLAQEQGPRPIPRFEEELVPQISPEVTYADGKLRIVARQARLADVLEGIRTQTGAVVSARPEIADLRVSMKIGPATVLDVINELLDAADCDYIVVGSLDSPSGLRVAALPRSHEAETVYFEAPAQANLKTPGNIPDEWNVTFTTAADKAESISSPREPVIAASEAASQSQQQKAPK